MELNIKKLLIGLPVRLRYVKRFSNCRTSQAESVAEHSYYTSLYALFIGEWVNARHKAEATPFSIDLAVLLRRALIHDNEEALTGDIIRTFKHSDVQLRREIDRSAIGAFNKVYDRVVDPETRQLYSSIWANAKDPTPEGYVLDFADYLSVLSYICEEVHAGNRTMLYHIQEMQKYSSHFKKPEYDFLSPLILEAEELLQQEILNHVVETDRS